jgi:Tol biopolymer transport system component
MLTKSGKSIGNARWSADGRQVAFTKGGQIWVADLKQKKGQWTLVKARQVSDIPNGVGEFKLSPDQKKIMYISYVKSKVDKPSDRYEDLDKATAYTTDDLMYRHWDHTVMEIPHTFVADFSFGMKEKEITPAGSTDILAGEAGLYELPTEPFGGLEQLDWSPDGKFIAYSCRKVEGKRYAFSTNTEIYIYNVESGETMQIEMGGGYDTDPAWSPDGSKLCWVSMERDGYEADKQRLMIAELDWNNGSMPKVSNIMDITAGFRYDANSPVWSEDSEKIYF